MRYYFLEGPDIGYLDMGLFQSKYTAMVFALQVTNKAANSKKYTLRNANDVPLATITSHKHSEFKWLPNPDTV